MKQHLQRFAEVAAGWRPDALMVAGAVAIAYGASLVYAPAGWIIGGMFALAAGWVLAPKAAK